MAKAQLSIDERETMRQRLSEAATAIYREQGLEAVSFRKLAESVQLSHTLPYLYFDNKDALLARMRRDGVDRFGVYLRGRERAGESPAQRLQALIVGVLDFVREHPADYQLIFSTQQPPPDRFPELLAARRELFDHLVDVVAACVEAGLLEGEPRLLTHGFWAAIQGLMSLHVANQLVHGYSMDQLVWPMIQQMFGFVPQPQAHPEAPQQAARRGGAAA
jgi:AcrR family transcriptional regulator